MQLQAFLRFFVQISITEVSFLKQILDREVENETDDDSKNPENLKNIWKHALKREAVHQLILNKVNTGIAEIKEQIPEIFDRDEVFEEMLFESSHQSRDIKNQVTFRLK